MSKWLCILIGCLMLSDSRANEPAMKNLDIIEAKESELSKFLWKNRLVVAQFESKSNLLKQQMEIFSNDTKGVKERKLLLIWVKSKQSSQYSKSNQFYLVGLDGGVKSTSPKPFTLSFLFQKIDAMPMRQSEFREKKNSK